MAECRTVTAVATVTQQTFNADGTVSTNTFDVTAEAGKVVAIDPYITIEQTEDGAVVTVTDAHGKTTATIYNGKDGADGADGAPGTPGEKGADGAPGAKGDKGDKGDPGEKGEPGTPGTKGDKGDKGDTGASGADGKDGVNGKDGADGFSPVANVSKSGNTTTISITDKNGTTTATVNDGVGDVASVNGKTGAVVLDAADVGALPDTTVIPVQSVNGMTGDVVVPDPFMLLDFMQIINVSIPSCLQDIQNTSIPNVDVSITDEMGAEWAIASLAKYEVADAETGGNRINVFPVCMFSMNSQKTLRLRMMAAGPNAKTAKRINGAILLKHR